MVRGAVLMAFGAAAIAAVAACNAVIGSRSLTYAPEGDDGGADATPPPAGDAANDSSLPPGRDAGDAAIDGGGGQPDTGGGSDTGTGADTGGSGDAGCTIPVGAACAVDPQCGCPASQKCDMPNGNAGCIDYGTSAVGNLCPGGATDCIPGTTCTNGVCHPFCATPGAPCTGAGNGPPLGTCTENGGNKTQGFLCPLSCKLYPNSCGNGGGCVPVKLGDGGAFSDCEAMGTGQDGDLCSTHTDCAIDFGCEASSGACRQWCQFDSTPTGCAAGKMCLAGITIDGVTYGFCE